MNAEAASIFPATAAEWLQHWDAGDVCHSIEMGGLGPGYEQCIQLMAAEFLRYFVEKKFKPETDEQFKTMNEEFRKHEEGGGFPIVQKLGPSGAQFGSAKNLAWMMYSMTPRGVMEDERVKDRHIVCSKSFPQVGA